MERSELADHVRAVRWRWRWALAPLILLPILSLYLGSRQVAVYEASARVLLQETAAQEAVIGRLNVNTGVRGRLLANEINRARGDDVTNIVRQELGLSETDPLPTGEITASPDSDVLIFSFSAGSADEAVDVANTWAQAYVDLRRVDALGSIDQVLLELEGRIADLQQDRQQIRSELSQLEVSLVSAVSDERRAELLAAVDAETVAIAGSLNVIDSQIDATIEDVTELLLTRELGSGSAELVRAAVPTSDPLNGVYARNLSIGIVLGTVVGIGLALLVDNLNRSLRAVADVERLGLTVLGSVPKVSRRKIKGRKLATLAQSDPGSAVADAHQKLRSAIQFRTDRDDIKTIAVTGPGLGDGATTIASNLALAFATVQSRVVLADLDLRRPNIHDVFDHHLVPGLSDVLIEESSLTEVVHSHPNLSTTILTIAAGTQPPNPSAVLSSTSIGGLVDRLRIEADLTIFDTPPVLLAADTLSIASRVDAVVLVVRAGETSPGDLEMAADSIVRAGGRLLGVIVNGVPGGGRQEKRTASAQAELSDRIGAGRA